jgi:hypothetical protein
MSLALGENVENKICLNKKKRMSLFFMSALVCVERVARRIKLK